MKYAIIFSLIVILFNAVDCKPLTIITANHTTKLRASNRSLKNISELNLYEKHRTITDIDVSNNSLKSIQSDDFRGISDLEIINLSDNQIQSIGYGAFRGLPYLTSLNLSYNLISRFPPALFVDNTRLLNLNVIGNPLESFNYNVFSPCGSSVTVRLPTKEITKLDISCHTENYRCPSTGCHKVCSFGGFNDMDYFENLTDLYASGTPIPISKLLSHVTSKLQILDVRHANVSNQILNGTLGKYTQLTDLYLSNNNLTSLDSIFGKTIKFDNLRILDLNENNLKGSTIKEIIDPTRFGGLKKAINGKLQIFGNDIPCNECEDFISQFDPNKEGCSEYCKNRTTTNAV